MQARQCVGGRGASGSARTTDIPQQIGSFASECLLGEVDAHIDTSAGIPSQVEHMSCLELHYMGMCWAPSAGASRQPGSGWPSCGQLPPSLLTFDKHLASTETLNQVQKAPEGPAGSRGAARGIAGVAALACQVREADDVSSELYLRGQPATGE